MGYERISDGGKVIKTKRDWSCEWCGQKILRGEQAIERIYKWDGDFHNARQHPECFEAMQENTRADYDGDGEFELNAMPRPILTQEQKQ